MKAAYADSARLRRALADRLQARDLLHDRRWRAAVETVPREAFLGGRVYQQVEGSSPTRWQPRSTAEIPLKEWLELVYRDETFVTQLDHSPVDQEYAGGEPVPGVPTSSSTLPSLVVWMLEDLLIDDGARVLEIGTGTGYSTALLCARLGSANVTSVEIDPGVAGCARSSLTATGYTPTLICGDGLEGHPGGAPYDALIATCSVRYLPRPWIDQVRPGGTILATLSGWLLGSALARIQITKPGYAEGRFLPGYVAFMPARPHDVPPLRALPDEDGYTERETQVGADILEDWTGKLVAQLAAPTAQYLPPRHNEEPALIYDRVGGAWARLYRTPHGTWRVRQAGPVKLWDDIENAWASWNDAGRPPHHEFTVSITPESQTVRLETPRGPLIRQLPVDPVG